MADCEYIITTEQIRAAWKAASDGETVGNTGFGWRVIKELGIVRCEGCGGSGKVKDVIRGTKETAFFTCSDCNGRGWVINATL